MKKCMVSQITLIIFCHHSILCKQIPTNDSSLKAKPTYNRSTKAYLQNTIYPPFSITKLTPKKPEITEFLE